MCNSRNITRRKFKMNEERIKQLRLLRNQFEKERDEMGEKYTSMILIIDRLITELSGGKE